MKKVIIPFFMLLMLMSLGGCATYNAVVPDWAQIGAESAEAIAGGGETAAVIAGGPDAVEVVAGGPETVEAIAGATKVFEATADGAEVAADHGPSD